MKWNNPKNFFQSDVMTSQFPIMFFMYTPCGRQTDHEVSSIRVITKNWWILKKSLGGNPIWGQKFLDFSLPKIFPHHPKYMGEKKIQKNEFLYGDPHTPITGSTGSTKQETKLRWGNVSCVYSTDHALSIQRLPLSNTFHIWSVE